jgi:hypothetical protein
MPPFASFPSGVEGFRVEVGENLLLKFEWEGGGSFGGLAYADDAF